MKMNSAKGLFSYDKNPMPKAKQVSSQFGPGGNADQMKANKLLQQAHAKHESLRGKAGM